MEREKLEATLRIYLTRKRFADESQAFFSEETIQSFADHSHSIRAEACNLATIILEIE